MPCYSYNCPIHGTVEIFKKMKCSSLPENCPVCGERMMRIIQPVAITGTRDNFGITNEFQDETGTIDTWKKWERAGYKDPKTTHKGEILEKIKRKEDKVRFDEGKKFSVGV